MHNNQKNGSSKNAKEQKRLNSNLIHQANFRTILAIKKLIEEDISLQSPAYHRKNLLKCIRVANKTDQMQASEINSCIKIVEALEFLI